MVQSPASHSQKNASSSPTQSLGRRELPYRIMAVLLGACLGLSAPGFDQWYLAWIGIAPLLWLTVTAGDSWLAGVRGFYFGTAYNLVYLSWFLYFRPVYSEGTFTLCPLFMSIAFWLLISAMQGVFLSIIPCILRATPLTGGWLPVKHHGRWLLPSFVIVPLLWFSIDQFCNAPVLLGFPWSHLEYSQYKQLPIIQTASLIGGIGLTACIILANVTILGIASYKRPELRAFGYRSNASLVLNSVVSISLLLSLLTFGILRLESDNRDHSKKFVAVSAVQANLSGRIHKVDRNRIAEAYIKLCEQCPSGDLCIWPEWSLDVNYTGEHSLIENIAQLPGRRQQSWVVGVFDRTAENKKFNAVCGMDASGKLDSNVYHKRYLVPFGEFNPEWVRETPFGTILYGLNKTYVDDTAADNRPVVFALKQVAVGPMLCFECLMPRLSVDSVRAGAGLLVDLSNTSWFYKSILSDQMIAFSTMRAVENHRSFVFSTGLGPSVIIDSVGRLLRQAPREERACISAEVPIENDQTFFTSWFCF